MKKYLLTGGMIVLFAIHLIYQRIGSNSNTTNNNGLASLNTPVQDSTLSNNSGSTSAGSTPPIDPATSSTPATTPPPTKIPPKPTSTPPPVITPKGAYKDGSYTGIAADAYYGYVQVRAIISGGKLTDVQFLQYPNDQDNSIQINMRALPILKAEAITAQSANVALVSRATDSSMAFQQSLASALAQAKN